MRQAQIEPNVAYELLLVVVINLLTYLENLS